VIASGKPLRPSTTAIRMSSTPRLRRLFITESQNLAPSLLAIQRPRTSRSPSGVTPQGHVNGLVFNLTAFCVAGFDAERIEENDGIHRFQSTVLPVRHLLQNSVRDTADQIRRNFQSIDFFKVGADI